MNRQSAAAIILVGGAAAAVGGWMARDFTTAQTCDYTASGYERLTVSVHTLPKLPLESVSDDVVGKIQKCWAAHPFVGPQHAIQFVDARRAPDGGYFLLFDPLGVSDVQLVFSVDANWDVTGSHSQSTF